jgi:branched-subunit amino acid ABC-type transport system permease component
MLARVRSLEQRPRLEAAPVLEFIVIQSLNGLVYSMLLFLLALGLSLTFGLLRVVNLAHGGFFLMGAYFGMSAWLLTQSFWAAILGAAVGTALVGGLLERLWLQRFYARAELDQVILTDFPASFLRGECLQLRTACDRVEQPWNHAFSPLARIAV